MTRDIKDRKNRSEMRTSYCQEVTPEGGPSKCQQLRVVLKKILKYMIFHKDGYSDS